MLKIIKLKWMVAAVFLCLLPIQAQAVPGDITTVASGGANFVSPRGLAFDTAGNVYVADESTNKVFKVATIGSVTMITVVAGTGALNGIWGDGGLATAATLPRPKDVAVDVNGDIYVTTVNTVRKITAATGVITTVVGAFAQTPLSLPTALAIHAGKLYIVDTNAHKVIAYDLTTLASSMAVNGIANPAGFGGDGSFATLASLNLPSDISFDPYGNYYIADTGNYRIRKVDTTGIISTVAGSGIAGTATTPAGDWDVATNVALNPLGVAADTYGNVYFTDAHGPSYERLVQMFAGGTMVTVSGKYDPTLYGTGHPYGPTNSLANSPYGKDAAASKLPLSGLSDIEVAASGEVYFVESNAKALRKLTPDNILPVGVSLTTRQASPYLLAPALTITNTANISLKSVCIDYTGCDQMQFSNDGVSWNPFVNYAQSYKEFYLGRSFDVPYTLPAGDGVKTVYARFKDRAGNVSASINQTVTLDTTAPAIPVISVPVADSYVNTWGNSISGTAEANASLSLYINGSAFTSAVFPAAADGTWLRGQLLNQNVTTTFQLTATDAAGNVSPLSAPVAVTYDTSPPTINNIPFSTVIVEYGTAYAAPNITVTDNIDTGLVPTVTGSAVDVYTLGFYLQTYSTQDRAGNVAQRQFQVQVVDTVAPVLTVPADITVQATDGLGISSGAIAVSAFLQGATATDNVDGTLTVSNDTTAILSVGQNTVTFTTSDYSGNTATATGVVTVTAAPVNGGGSGGGGAADGGGGGCLAPTSTALWAGLLPMLGLLGLGLFVARRKEN